MEGEVGGRVTVRLLGPIDVIGSDRSAHSSGSALRRTLLALLALRSSETVTADWLLDAAWNEDPPESGLRAVRFHVSQLRRELPEAGLIDTRPGGYSLSRSRCGTDVEDVEELLREARAAADPQVAAAAYERALAPWRGDALSDASPCRVLEDEAHRLTELRLSIVGEYYSARLASGAGPELVPDLSRLCAQHPLQESLWAALMTAQYRAGRQADALRSFEKLRTALADTAGLSPSPPLQELQSQILAQAAALDSADPPVVPGTRRTGRAASVVVDREGPSEPRRRDQAHNLATVSTVRIDSDGRLAAATDLVRNHRVVTLTGPGGVGKTRLAVDVGWASLAEFSNGVWWVDLSAVVDEDSVAATLMSTLSIRPGEGASASDTLLDWFHGRDLLLVLDNCEYLSAAARRLVGTTVASCPSVRLLVTSREPLGLPGERVHRLTVLDAATDGVTLFVERAVAADSAFVLEDGDLAVVAEICQRLDGLPLAIELAAARVGSMAPTDLRDRLDDRFRLLRLGDQGRNDRHATLRATVEWSYRMLDERERSAFDVLSVFAGSFDLAAAEAVCAGAFGDPACDVVGVVGALVDKSLVVMERQATGARYRLLETLRNLAAENLVARAVEAEARDRHLEHYLDVAERADAEFRTARQVAAGAVFDREWENLRRALDWAVSTHRLDVAERLLWACRLFASSRMRVEHQDWCERILSLEAAGLRPGVRTWTQAWVWAAIVEDDARFAELEARLLEVLDPDDPDSALALGHLEATDRVPDPQGALERLLDRIDLDREWWVLLEVADRWDHDDPSPEPLPISRLVTAAKRIGAPRLVVAASLFQGHLAMVRRGDFLAARDLYTRALGIAVDAADVESEGDARRALAMAATALRAEDALDRCRDALEMLYDVRNWTRVWQLLRSLGLEWAERGRLESAAIVMAAAETRQPSWGYEYRLGFHDRAMLLVRRSPLADEWLRRGVEMGRHEVVEYALACLASP